MKRITQGDIAEKLNISRVTVSKALLGKPGISPATRDKVLAAIEDMGGSPEALSSIHKRKAVQPAPSPGRQANDSLPSTVALLMVGNFNGTNSFWTIYLQRIGAELHRLGIGMRLFFIDPETEKKEKLPEEFLSDPPDALITIGTFSTAYYLLLASQNIPMVSRDISVDLYFHPICDTICSESEKSSYLLTKHLIDKGHRRIEFVGLPDICTSFYHRWLGFRNAVMDAGLPVPQKNYFQFPTNRSQYEVNHLYSFIQNNRDRLPTAFVCANDSIASFINLLRTMHPDTIGKIELTGFDNYQQLANLIPDVSTAELFPEAVADTLVNQLLWRFSNRQQPFRSIFIDTEVIFR